MRKFQRRSKRARAASLQIIATATSSWELTVVSSSKGMPAITEELIVGHPLILEGGRGISAKADRFRYNGRVEFE